MGGELWHWQAQNWVNLAFQVKFDPEGQGQFLPHPHPPKKPKKKPIGNLTKLFYIFCPNLVLLAWTCDELRCRQAQGWWTHTHTDTHTQTQATAIPGGINWPRVKIPQEQLSHPLLPSSSNSLPNKMLATSTRVLVNFGLLMFLKKKWNEYKNPN